MRRNTKFYLCRDFLTDEKYPIQKSFLVCNLFVFRSVIDCGPYSFFLLYFFDLKILSKISFRFPKNLNKRKCKVSSCDGAHSLTATNETFEFDVVEMKSTFYFSILAYSMCLFGVMSLIKYVFPSSTPASKSVGTSAPNFLL